VKTASTTRRVWTNITEAEDEARRLWRLAIDAEQNQDFVEAVALYEQIKQLPSTVHPAGLQVRLSLAKKLTK
jgi:cytochrome c-type biogenesis protein CcmH/NrfG